MHAAAFDHQERTERRFLNALFSRATPVTYAILIFNLAIYLVMALVAGGNFFQTLVYMNDLGTLVAFGAKTNALLQSGEWFRLVTPIFIHGGLLHLASNSYAIWSVGPLVEKLYGSARYLLIFLLSGIGGVIGSYLGGMARPSWIPGVGASGAIFGLFGVLVVFGYKYRSELPPNFLRSIKSGILPVIVINLFIGFSIPYIDNAAHIGGLISGALLALIIPYIYIAPGRARVSITGLAILAGCVLVIVVSFILAYQNRSPHLAKRSQVVEEYLNSISEADEAMTRSYQYEAGQDKSQSTEVLAARLVGAANRLEKAMAPDERAGKLRAEMVDLTRRQAEVIKRPISQARSTDLSSNGNRLLQIRKDFEDWVKSEGEKYGFRFKPGADALKQ